MLWAASRATLMIQYTTPSRRASRAIPRIITSWAEMKWTASRTTLRAASGTSLRASSGASSGTAPGTMPGTATVAFRASFLHLVAGSSTRRFTM